MPKAPQDNISRSLKHLSLGMPRMASSLSSSFIGNLTWSYIFIRHMICVLLGVSFYFVICFMLFRIMFCIYIFNKNVKDSLFHAYFASIYVAVSKQKVYRCCKSSLENSENDIILKLLAYWDLIDLLHCSSFPIIFGVREVWWILHSLQTILFWQIAVMFALFAYACLFNYSIWG